MSVALDCQACKAEKSMAADTVPRFGGFIRLAGFILAIPALIGMFMGGAMMLSSCSIIGGTAGHGADKTSPAIHAGVGVMGVGFSIVVFFSAFAGGIVSWLLLSRRKVFLCGRCGFVLDRG